jgi:hypothetical protein
MPLPLKPPGVARVVQTQAETQQERPMRHSKPALAMPTLSAVALIGLFASAQPGHASAPDLAIGRGFLCDTETEVMAAVTPDDSKIQANLASVNTRFGKDSCTFATALFGKTGDGEEKLTSAGAVRVEKVSVFGYFVGDELKATAAPKAQYFAAPQKGAGV